jgi:hypothetical protein
MLVNTEYFREEARKFQKTGYYTQDPIGSSMWRDYWAEQLERCINGYEVGGLRITGDHYFYLNFCQIRLTDNVKGVSKIKTARKITTFPDFWDGDYSFFHVKDIARNGIHPSDLAKLNLDYNIHPDHLNGGRHVIVGKARRKGYSYKNGAIVVNAYNTKRKSLCLIGAFEKKYLYPKGTMQMVTDYMNFINEHTAFAKRRGVVDKQDHRRASFLEMTPNGSKIEKGYMSEVIAVSYKDNPDAARGKDADLVLFEEAGKFDNLKASYLATKHVVEDGEITTGQMIIFGTGGDMEGGTIDFESMFYNPEPYNLLPVENIWDEGGQGTFCGFFHPSYMNKIGFIDRHGNTLKDKAIESEVAIRENIRRTSKDPGTYDKHITEYPFTPKEGFLQTGNNIFPLSSIVEHKNYLNRSNITKYMAVNGVLYRNDKGKADFRPDERVRPVDKFPHDNKADNTGCVIVYQPPYREGDTVPENLYFICHDPYDHDGTSGSSIGAAYVIKRPNNLSQPDDMIVASYIGRPATQDEYNMNLFMLAEYYNCRVGFENDRGDVIGYAKRFKHLDRLEEEFELSYNSNLPKSGVRRGYGMHMTEARKRQGELYLRDWLLQGRSVDEKGNKMFNLHAIYDTALLDELRTYNPVKGNFDRVSALLIGMYYMKEIEFKQLMVRVKEEKLLTSLFERELF